MKIRLLTPDDANLYRDIRLAALKMNPEAFASSYEEELLLPLEAFKGRLQPGDSFTFGVFEDSGLAGVVTMGAKTEAKAQDRYICNVCGT